MSKPTKQIAFENEAVVSYIPTMSNCDTPNKTMMEVVQLVSAHTADVLLAIMKILSERYGHSINEMMDVVRTNPQFHAIQVHPIMTAEFFNNPAAVSHLPIAAAPVAPAPVAPVPVNTKKAIKIVKKIIKPVEKPAAQETLAEKPTIKLETNLDSPGTRSPPSPLSEVVVIDSPPAATVIDMSNVPQPVLKRSAVIIKKKEIVEADKKEVKPHNY
jgi:hypothetical protein